MQLELRNVSTKVGEEFHITDVSLAFEAGTLNIFWEQPCLGKHL